MCFMRARTPALFVYAQGHKSVWRARSGHLPINGGMLRSSERVLSEDATPEPFVCALCGTCAPWFKCRRRPAAPEIQSGDRVSSARALRHIFMQTGFFDGHKGVDKWSRWMLHNFLQWTSTCYSIITTYIQQHDKSSTVEGLTTKFYSFFHLKR
jgi:hypothetical protein